MFDKGTRAFAACALAVLLAPGSGWVLWAAEHGGQVAFDGAPVPGATVVAIRGEQRVSTTTNVEGTYRFEELADGPWTMRVEMPGFVPAEQQVSVAAGAAPTRWDLDVQPFEAIAQGGVAEPGLPPPGAAAAANGQVIGAPVAPVPSAGARGQPPASTAGGGTAPTNGLSSTLLDTAAQNPIFGAVDSFLVNGSVRNAAATPFAQPVAFGTARLRATRSPYRFMSTLGGRDSAWDARPYGAVSRPDSTSLSFSTSVSGPIRLPWLRRDGPMFTLTASRATSYDATSSALLVPTALERAGDFSATQDGFGNPVQILDPLTGEPFPGNRIPGARLSPQARALLAYYPEPNAGGDGRTNYLAAPISDNHGDSVSLRVQRQPLGRLTGINGGVNYSRSAGRVVTPFGFEDESRGSSVSSSVQVDRRLSSFLVMQVRHDFSRSTASSDPYFANRVNVSGLAGITGNNQDPVNWGPPTLGFRTVAGLSTGTYSRTRTIRNTTVIENSFSYRRHVMSFGGEIERRALDVVSQQNPRGTFFFSGDLTGSDFADFLLGQPRTSAIAYGNADKLFRQMSFAAFVTDDLRLSPSFTLSLGVRWEYEAPVVEAQDRLVNLDIASDFTGVSPVIADDPVGALTGRSYARSLVHPDRVGVQPRVAMAWRPFLGSSVIVRAGYGIYRNTNVYQTIATVMAQQPPLSFTVSAERSAQTPLTLANGFVPSPSITQNTFAIDPAFRVGYAHNWQASIQRDLASGVTLSGTYVGVKGSRLPQVLLPNTFPPGAVSPCPECPSGYRFLTSNGSSWVHRGQVQVRKRLSGGFTASGQYTLSRGEDNASSFTSIGGTPAQNWLDLDAEWGPSEEIRRHEYGAQFSYTTGVGLDGIGLRERLLRGWTLTAQFSGGSGQPLTPVYATALQGTAVSGTVRASLTGEPVGAIPEGAYLNPAAYGAPLPGAWGDVPRNSVRGPALFSLNGALARTFQLGSQRSLTWQVDATNLLNRVVYTSVNTFVGSPQFGLPTAVGGMRRLSTSLRITY
jgi:hypothetical protein